MSFLGESLDGESYSMKSSGKYWDKIFSRTEDSELGWYEKDASKTLELLDHIDDWENATAFLPGVGTSILAEELLSRGVKLVLNDISPEVLNRVKDRLGDKCTEISWLCQDVARPIKETIPDIDIWIDRAVLHFLTDEDDIAGYFDNVKSVLRAGSFALFAEFSLTGATMCAGLAVHRYSVEQLSKRLGSAFELLSQFEFTYTSPSGDPRPYIYALFKRES